MQIINYSSFCRVKRLTGWPVDLPTPLHGLLPSHLTLVNCLMKSLWSTTICSQFPYQLFATASCFFTTFLIFSAPLCHSSICSRHRRMTQDHLLDWIHWGEFSSLQERWRFSVAVTFWMAKETLLCYHALYLLILLCGVKSFKRALKTHHHWLYFKKELIPKTYFTNIRTVMLCGGAYGSLPHPLSFCVCTVNFVLTNICCSYGISS